MVSKCNLLQHQIYWQFYHASGLELVALLHRRQQRKECEDTQCIHGTVHQISVDIEWQENHMKEVLY